jgi:hypothetical protein
MRDIRVQMPDGEKWVGKWDDELQDCFWEPMVVVDKAAHHAVSWKDGIWTAGDGISHRATSRTEWIDNVLYSGTDTFVRQPLTSGLSRPAGEIAVFSRLLVWNDSLTSWTVCRQGGWIYSSATSDFLARTFNWGPAPCGVKFYTAIGWAAHWNSYTSRWVVSPAIDPGDEGGQNLGLAVDGKVWNGKRPAPVLSSSFQLADPLGVVFMPPVPSVQP